MLAYETDRELRSANDTNIRSASSTRSSLPKCCHSSLSRNTARVPQKEEKSQPTLAFLLWG